MRVLVTLARLGLPRHRREAGQSANENKLEEGGKKRERERSQQLQQPQRHHRRRRRRRRCLLPFGPVCLSALLARARACACLFESESERATVCRRATSTQERRFCVFSLLSSFYYYYLVGPTRPQPGLLLLEVVQAAAPGQQLAEILRET